MLGINKYIVIFVGFDRLYKFSIKKEGIPDFNEVNLDVSQIK